MARRPESSDDVVRVLLDPFQDKRNAYVFFVNPTGARGEGLAYAGELQPQLGRHLGGRQPPPRRRLVDRDPHPLQDDLLPPGPQRLGPEHRADDRPQNGGHQAFRDDPGQQLQQPERSGPDARGSRASSRAWASPSALTAWPAAPKDSWLGPVRLASSTAASTSTRASRPTSSASPATTWISPRPRSTSGAST